MSDVVRNYSHGGSLRRRRRELRRRSTLSLGRGLLITMVILVSAALWVTRNNYEMGSLVPKDRPFQACLFDVMGKQHMLRSSRLAEVLPEGSAREVFAKATANPPLPEWLLNNLSTGASHWSSSRVDDFNDLLVITRMTRIGCLVEKFARVLPMIKSDYSGGLRLRHLPDTGLYYAVRGRILLLSPSRRIMVHALTLDGNEAAGEAALAEWTKGAEGADLFGRVDPAAMGALGGGLESMEFSLWIQPASMRASIKGRLAEVWKNKLAPFLDGLDPRELKAPPDGCVMLSANFGKPLTEVAAAVAAALGKEQIVQPWLGDNAAANAGIFGPLLTLSQTVLRTTNGGVRLSWLGFDVNEMLPVPIFAGSLDGGVEAISALLKQPPPLPTDTPEIDTVPRVDVERKLVYVPLVGGPSIKPTFAIQGDGLVISTSLTEASNLLGASEPAKMDKKGNLYLVVRPKPALQSVVDAGKEFAEFGFMRGQTLASFTESFKTKLEMAGRINEAKLLLAHENGQISADFEVSLP